MKSSRGSSLYEVLKNASRPSGSPEGAAPAPAGEAGPAVPAQTLQERLAAYKAAQLAAAQQPTPEAPSSTGAVATAQLEAPVQTIVLTPEPTPPPLPVITAVSKVTPKTELLDPLPTPIPQSLRVAAEAPEGPRPLSSTGPGERVLRVTYNTAAFAALVVVGVVFISYAVGMHLGKAASAGEVPVQAHRPPVAPVQAAAPVPPPVPAPVPAAPKREFTLRLTEWKYGSSQERLKANAAADDLKKALDRAGHKGAEKAVVKRGEELRLALYLGQFTDLNSGATRAKLATIKAFKVQNATPFSLAVFEEAPK